VRLSDFARNRSYNARRFLMKLASLSLEAFYEVAKGSTVSSAARKLGITQSALSQRILKLESELEGALFIRKNKNLFLTELGHRLLGLCHVENQLETEFLTSIKSSDTEVAGVLRVAAYSSILRSAVIPAFSEFLKNNPKVEFSFRSYEIEELPSVLSSYQADIVIADFAFHKNGVEELYLGNEEYVVIESLKKTSNSQLYLDHGPEDKATESFFLSQPKANSKVFSYKRAYLGDVYALIEGVEEGLGRAVMSKHLIKNNKKIRIVDSYKKYARNVVAHYNKAPYYSTLFKKALIEISKISNLLNDQ